MRPKKITCPLVCLRWKSFLIVFFTVYVPCVSYTLDDNGRGLPIDVQVGVDKELCVAGDVAHFVDGEGHVVSIRGR